MGNVYRCYFWTFTVREILWWIQRPRLGDTKEVIDSRLVNKKKSGRPNHHWNLPHVIEDNGEPWRARTSDPLIKSQLLYQLS
jgi:hypothetical protein